MTDHNSTSSRITRQSFTHQIRFTSSSSAASLNVDPVNSSSFFGAQVSNMANIYNEFRCVKIIVRMKPNQITDVVASNGSSQTSLYIGYSPVPPATSPSTATEICQLDDNAIIVSGQNHETVFKLGRKQLMGLRLLKWYHQDTTPNTVTDMQGRIFYIAAGTNSTTWVQQWHVQSVWEFRAPVPFGLFMKSLVESKQTICVDSKSQVSDDGDTPADPPGTAPPMAICLPRADHLERIYTPVELSSLKLLLTKLPA